MRRYQYNGKIRNGETGNKETGRGAGKVGNGSGKGRTVQFATLRNVVGVTGKRIDTDMVIDSGASEHVVSDIRFFEELNEVYRITIETADGNSTSTNSKSTFDRRGNAGFGKRMVRTAAPHELDIMHQA